MKGSTSVPSKRRDGSSTATGTSTGSGSGSGAHTAGNEPKPDQAVIDALNKRSELEAAQQARDEEIAITRSQENTKNETPTNSSAADSGRRPPPEKQEAIALSTRTTESERGVLMNIVAAQASIAAAEHLVKADNLKQQVKVQTPARVDSSQNSCRLAFFRNSAPNSQTSKQGENSILVHNEEPSPTRDQMPMQTQLQRQQRLQRPGAYRGAPGEALQRTESLQFSLVGANTGDFEPMDILDAGPRDFVIHSAANQPSEELLQATAVGELVTPGEDLDEEAIRQQAEIVAEERLLASAAQAEVVPTRTPDEQEVEDYSKWQRFTCSAIGFLLLIVVLVVIAVSVSRKEVIITLAPSQAPTTASPSSAPSMAPSFFTNNLCRGAHPVQINAAVRDSTLRNTQEESVATCQDIRTNGRGQWFAVEGADAWLHVHTCGSGTNYDTQLSVYEAGGGTLDDHPCDVAVCVTGNDQHCGDQSYVHWFGQAGSHYFILVHGYRLYTGDFEMEVLEENNGVCDGAFNISQPVFDDIGRGRFRIQSSMEGAKLVDSDQLPECDDNSQKPSGIGVWYTIDGQNDSPTYDIGSELNVAVYKGSCSMLSCVHVDTSDAFGVFNFDTFNFFDREEGVTFYLLVYGNTTATETSFELSITWAQAGFSFRTPDNAYCEAVSNNETFALEPNQVGFQAWTPTTRFGLDTAPSCGDQVWHTSSGLWYSAVGTGRAMTVSTCPNVTAETPDFGRDFLDTQISVYTGSCDSLVCVDGNDQFCGDQSAVSWFTEAGVEYLILVHGYDSREGYFEVWYDDAVPDLSPSCQVAITISADGTSNLGSTISNNDTQSIAFCGFGGGGGEEGSPGSWYQAVGTGQTWTASTCSSNTGFSARVSVYEGAADCSYIACLPTSASESSPCGDQNAVTWRTIPNQTYYFLIHGQDPSASGDFVFTLEETSSNDNCEGTIGPLTVDDGLTTFGSTRSATFDDYVPTCGSEGRGTTGRGLFYSLIGTGENITASTCSPYTNFDMKIAVYFGSCIDLQCVAVKPSDCEVNEDGATYFGMSITWPSQPNDFYYLLVQGQDEETGNFGLEVFTAAFDLSEG